MRYEEEPSQPKEDRTTFLLNQIKHTQGRCDPLPSPYPPKQLQPLPRLRDNSKNVTHERKVFNFKKKQSSKPRSFVQEQLFKLEKINREASKYAPAKRQAQLQQHVSAPDEPPKQFHDLPDALEQLNSTPLVEAQSILQQNESYLVQEVAHPPNHLRKPRQTNQKVAHAHDESPEKAQLKKEVSDII